MAPDPWNPQPGAESSPESPSLGTLYQRQYRDTFQAAVAAGRVKPFVLPWSLLGSFFLPLLYLSIPHTKRPWLYRMRWLVAAACVYLNMRVIQTTSSGNEAVAYVAGCAASWGTFWSLRLLLFTRPQWEAARVERRPRKSVDEKVNVASAPDESVAAALPRYEYFWQFFPADESFATRLGWTVDLLVSSRGAGWNHAISTIPHPPFRPSDPATTTTVRLDRIPLASPTGTARSPTYAAFLRSRLLHLAVSWLVIDLLTATIRQDPYFLVGPDYNPSLLPLSPFLATLPLRHLTLPLVRNVAAFAGIVAGLHLYAAVAQLVECLVPPFPSSLGARADLWQHPTLFGGAVASVLDRGLAGFWGGWWHQMFRHGFVAPARCNNNNNNNNNSSSSSSSSSNSNNNSNNNDNNDKKTAEVGFWGVVVRGADGAGVLVERAAARRRRAHVGARDDGRLDAGGVFLVARGRRAPAGGG
ncbi:hypothetical protein VTK26DRAFT_4104 [Humicola hyalothermophila]